MKYSIVVPVYNADKYLSECIESVLRQTYSDWELILIDDGSTDRSGEICDNYAKLDNRIVVVHSENQGGYKARLLGNEYITGDYSIGLDSDDMYEPYCLERLENCLVQTDVDMVIFGRKELINGSLCDVPECYETKRIYSTKELLSTVIKTKDHSLGNKAVKSDIYKSARYISEEYKLSINLDFIQVVPILCKTESAYYLDESMYIYRIYDNSISHTLSEQKIIDTDWIHSKLYTFLKEEKLLDDEIKQTLLVSYSRMIYPRLRELIRIRSVLDFFNTKLNCLDFMRIVYENKELVGLKKKEEILYKEAIRGRMPLGVIKSHFAK